MQFFRRLIKYSLSVREHYPKLPIVIAICVHHTSEDLLSMTTESEALPFTRELSCQGWGQSCYLFDKQTISDYPQQIPLDPLAALAYTQLNMAKQTLMEDIPDETSTKRTIDCLDCGMRFIGELRKKHRIDPSSADAPSQPTTESGVHKRSQRPNHDWQFVDAYRDEQGKDMDWNKCFELGKEKGLFKKYAGIKSAKAAYFRAKKD